MRQNSRQYPALGPGPEVQISVPGPPQGSAGSECWGFHRGLPARGPFTPIVAHRSGREIFFLSPLISAPGPVLRGSPQAHPSRGRAQAQGPRAPPPVADPCPWNPLLEDDRHPEKPHCVETHPTHWSISRTPPGRQDLLTGLAAAGLPYFTLLHRLAEAAAARPEIAAASGSFSPQPNPRPRLFPPSCFSAPPPPIPDLLSVEHAGLGVKAEAGQWGLASRLKPPVSGRRRRALLARRFGCACAMDSAARWYWQ